jgi:hypothetical protein
MSVEKNSGAIWRIMALVCLRSSLKNCSLLLYQVTTSQLAEKLGSFEGAQLQLCRKECRMSPALAAEGWFFSSGKTFSASCSVVP